MNIRDFEYMLAIVQEKNFGRAAALCNVSQSTLSIQIKKLEEYLGVQIFERTNKQVTLTKVGDKIYEMAKKIIETKNSIKQIAKNHKDPMSGDISIGAFPTLAPYIFPLSIANIKKSLPQINLQLVEEKTAILLEMLESGKLDCALIAAPLQQTGIKSVNLFYEPFYLAVPVKNRLAKNKYIKNKELAKEEMLLLDEGHCLHSQASQICSLIGGRESDKFRATSMETLRQMVAIGNSVTLMPELSIRENDKEINYIPMQSKDFGRTIVLAWRKSSNRDALFKKLASIIAKSFASSQALKNKA